MTEYYEAYGTVIALLVAGIALVAVAFTLGRLVSPKREYGRYGEKRVAFESGIDPVGFGWSQTNIRYYMFAFMFVIFDVETVFMLPSQEYMFVSSSRLKELVRFGRAVEEFVPAEVAKRLRERLGGD